MVFCQIASTISRYQHVHLTEGGGLVRVKKKKTVFDAKRTEMNNWATSVFRTQLLSEQWPDALLHEMNSLHSLKCEVETNVENNKLLSALLNVPHKTD